MHVSVRDYVQVCECECAIVCVRECRCECRCECASAGASARVPVRVRECECATSLGISQKGSQVVYCSQSLSSSLPFSKELPTERSGCKEV